MDVISNKFRVKGGIAGYPVIVLVEIAETITKDGENDAYSYAHQNTSLSALINGFTVSITRRGQELEYLGKTGSLPPALFAEGAVLVQALNTYAIDKLPGIIEKLLLIDTRSE